jgi:integrase/recombinase XerD
VQELIELFIRERTYFKNVSPKTQSWYRQSFRAFEGALETRTAIGDRIGQLLGRGVSAISINTYLECINAFHRWATTEGHLTGETVHIPRLKQEQKVLATLSPEQVQRIVGFKGRAGSERRIHTIAVLLLDTGLRIDEALSLTRDDVDLDNMLLRVRGKGGKHRLVPVSSEMRKVLWRWLQDRMASLVFSTRTGTKLLQRNLLRDFKLFGKRLKITGVRFSFHTLRHTFAVNYIRNGGDVFRLQRVLGHSSLEMTRRYVNLQTEDLKAVHDRLSVVGKGVA